MSEDRVVLCYAARHGQTLLNAEGCFRGNKDVMLDAVGKRQAKDLVDFFSDKEVDFIVCSDRKRAVETTKPIAAAKGLSFHRTPELHALNVGEFSGQPKTRENVEKLEYYIQHPEVPIPGGESLDNFRARVRPMFAAGLDVFDRTGQVVLFVIHSSGIHELGQMIHGDHNAVLVNPGGVVEVYLENGKIQAEPIYRKHVPDGSADTVS